MLLKLRFGYFFAAFAVGLFFCYVLTPPPEVVIKFPTPYNAGAVRYKNDADTCYVYRADKVACPFDRTMIKPQPVAASATAP